MQLVPSRSWSTSGASTSQPSLLGLSLRLCNPQHALEQVSPIFVNLWTQLMWE